MIDTDQLTADALLVAFRNHIGHHNGASATRLVWEMTGTSSRAAERRLRMLVMELRKRGHHICAQPVFGYFLAETPEELENTCQFLRDRALAGLQQVAAMRRISIPDLVGQMHLPT